jgi:hypothetical protein
MFQKIGCFAVVLFSFVGVQSAFADQLVTNGGFETGDFTGWTLAGPVTSSTNPSAFYGVDSLDAATGNYGAYLSTDSTQLSPNQLTLSQTLTVQPSHEYVISFSLAQDAAPSLPTFGNLFELTFGNQVVDDVINAPVSGFTNYSFTVFTPSSATSEALTFSIENDLGYFSLDNVSVSSAPEPATLVLLAPAVGVLAFVRRKLV